MPLNLCIFGDDFEIKRSWKSDVRANEVLQDVIATINLKEEWFFGLHDGTDWLVPKSKVRSQIHKTTKYTTDKEAIFYFRPMYYPKDAEDVISERAMAYVFEDVRKKCSSGELLIPNSDLGFQMAALSIQVQYGDFDGKKRETEYTSCFAEKHFPEYLANGTNMKLTESIEAAIKDFQRPLKGMSPEQGRFEYIRLAQNLPGYGKHEFNLRRVDLTNITLVAVPGNCQVYINQGGVRVLVDTYLWNACPFSLKGELFTVGQHKFELLKTRNLKKVHAALEGYSWLNAIRSAVSNLETTRLKAERDFGRRNWLRRTVDPSVQVASAAAAVGVSPLPAGFAPDPPLVRDVAEDIPPAYDEVVADAGARSVAAVMDKKR